MNPSLWLAATAILLLAVSTAGWSKGPITRILIEGDYLNDAIEITDPAVLDEFSIWNGPGVGTGDPQAVPNLSAMIEPAESSGWFIDWPRGFATDRPAGLQRLQVTFHIGVPQQPGATRAFVFAYEPDPGAGRGYVYLPQWKNSLIWHGVELHWLYAHSRWNDAVMPLIRERSAESFGRSQLDCTVGEGEVDPDGTIRFVLINEAGEKTSRWRYERTSRGYRDVKAHLGDVEPGQLFEISCWPPRS